MLLTAFGKKARPGTTTHRKTGRMMKKLTLSIVTICLLVHTGSAQTLTLSASDISLEEAFLRIQAISPYRFVYTSEKLEGAPRVTINARNAGINEVLAQCFRNQSLTWSVDDKIILVRQPVHQSPSASTRDDSLVRITGKILDAASLPVSAASITVKNKRNSAASDDNGNFAMLVSPAAILLISHIGFAPLEIPVKGRAYITVTLQAVATSLQNVDVVFSTGYLSTSREKTTGSFVQVDNALLNRSVSTNILDRLDGVTSGLVFNKNINAGTNQSSISIRGRSTIYSNPNPLIILDNFPFDGDLNNINPNDIESITVLKDASAAAIWGSFSGNGVIVITSKKGGYNQAPKISFNSNITMAAKPDLHYNPILSSSGYIEIEKFLFDQGWYNSMSPYQAVTPVVALLQQRAAGTIAAPDAAARIDALRPVDMRNDLDKYFYRHAANQQYAINVEGGDKYDKYFLSAGFDKNLAGLVRNSYNRATINLRNTLQLFDQKLELCAALLFTQSNTRNNNTGYPGIYYPYAQLADDNGNALAVPSRYATGYSDTAGHGLLLDWHDRPLDNIRNADNHIGINDYHINGGLTWHVAKGLDLAALYQFNRGISTTENYFSPATFFTRNLINQYAQTDPTANAIQYSLPPGGILDHEQNEYYSHNARIQGNYTHQFAEQHQLSLLGGWELRDIESQLRNYRLYGYNAGLQTSSPVNMEDYFPLFYNSGIQERIPDNTLNRKTINRFISFYGNGSYTYVHRYTLSGSIRRDESNIFGVNANQRGVPLWSAGAAWEISREKFFQVPWLPYLRVRFTDGYSGNVNNSVSAYTTASFGSATNAYGAQQAAIDNPPNPSLRWEKIHILNLGIDFGSKNNRVTGSMELYQKNGQDLIGASPIDPTTGIIQFTGNTADMKGKGIDITLTSKNTTGPVRWTTTLLYNYTIDRVSTYKVKSQSVSFYTSSTTINPFEGRPLYSVFSFPWGGLDNNGNPQGFLNGKPSNDYGAILNSTNLNDLQYNGPANPVHFGSLRNTVTWKGFTLSANISFKLGYYFRRPSINYFYFMNSNMDAGHPDYEKRWQKPGDEQHTSVQAMIYPADYARDAFYSNASMLVDKGDHIRLQDLQVSYDLDARKAERLHLHGVRFYLYANNIGIIWKANHDGIDPDYQPGPGYTAYPQPRTIAAGLKLDL